MANGLYSEELKKVFEKFKKPGDIQDYLNNTPYNGVEGNRYPVNSPLVVSKVKTAFCSEGALFAAAALRYLGYQPLVVMLKAARDEDHFIAVFKIGGRWGCFSKASYITLGYREPVYKSLRELVMSYFDTYFRKKGRRKTLRGFTRAINLKMYDKYNWMNTEKDLSFICYHFDKLKINKVITRRMITRLRPVERLMVQRDYIPARIKRFH